MEKKGNISPAVVSLYPACRKGISDKTSEGIAQLGKTRKRLHERFLLLRCRSCEGRPGFVLFFLFFFFLPFRQSATTEVIVKEKERRGKKKKKEREEEFRTKITNVTFSLFLLLR
eukprot:TRINITY_DN11335_c0_g1_i1.p2 TRINITY_DN11335_c0_g1~~TRINITY_DN11335_c0_g1_i1.p2  ORF type:complete len:115 (+),score=5.55 TRINITY_DN11335_c0_g1_i1:115-459(+)